MSGLFAKSSIPVGLIVLLASCSGCGTGEYKTRLDARLPQLSQETPFSRMYAATAIADTPVKVRIPQFFKNSPLVEGLPAEAPVDSRRAKPPFDIDDLKLAYEDFVTDSSGGKVSYYCYLAVTDMSRPGARDPSAALWQRLRTMFTETPLNPTEVQYPRPDGRGIQWKKAVTAGPQEFYYQDKNGAGSYRPENGTIQTYCRREGDFMVLIVWRVPQRVEKNVGNLGLDQWAGRVAGTVMVEGG